jgi:diacylglycerol O-acyltransferase
VAPGAAFRNLPALPGVLRRELRRDATLTTLAAPAGVRREVAFASLPFAELRAAGKAIDERVTVNDVVLATLAGALREWLPGPLPAGDRIRVKVPVSLHGAGDDQANHDSYFFTELPVHEPDPVARVLAVSRDTRERKLHHDAEALYHLGLHPAFAHAAMSPHVFTFNVSNVPGPRGPVTMLGATITQLYSLAEIADQHALRVAVISLSGRLFFGLNGDADSVGDLPALAAGIERAAAELTPASR